MVMAVVSTFALVLAFGPQLQVNLQAVLEEPVAAAESRDEEREVELPLVTDEAPVIEQSIETVEETLITPDEIAESEDDPAAPVSSETDLPETSVPEASETEPESAPVQNGEVPESDWPAILNEASTALAAAKTARGNFIQSNADGTVYSGTFALNRPGRMRFDYDDPTPYLIVSDGTTVAWVDREIDTVDRGPIGATPLGILLSTQLDVDEDVEILSVLQNENRIGIRVSDASGELEGTMTMVFDKTSFDLLGWLTVDANSQTTVVDLTDVETNVRIDPRLFRLNEDDEEEDER